MEDTPSPMEAEQVPTQLSRRGLFRFGKKVGAHLLMFVPAAAILLQNIPARSVLSQVGEQGNASRLLGYIPCSKVRCAGFDPKCGAKHPCYDLNDGSFCCCSYTSHC